MKNSLPLNRHNCTQQRISPLSRLPATTLLLYTHLINQLGKILECFITSVICSGPTYNSTNLLIFPFNDIVN